jgi:hypothetical protein
MVRVLAAFILVEAIGRFVPTIVTGGAVFLENSRVFRVRVMQAAPPHHVDEHENRRRIADQSGHERAPIW